MEPGHEPGADPVLHVLQPGERVELNLTSEEAGLHLTDLRLVVTSDDRVRLDVRYEGLRRIQFDLEHERPAVMVIVPHDVERPPQMLTIPREQLHRAAELLAFIGERLP